MKTVLRNMIADYLQVPGTGDTKEYVLMGTGFKSLDESPGAKMESTIYINQVSESSTITQYATKFPFTADTIADEKAVMALYNVGRDHLTGIDAEFEYIRVDLYSPGTTGKFKARKFKVAAEISDFKGNGGEKVEVSGTLNAVGDPIQGEFDITTKAFTESSKA
ncbi:MAG: hypothetical protein ACRDD7_14295 [Peptostreptococcaceae bacterium]